MPDSAGENPLIPNKKLRGLYTAMAELRLLEEFLASRRPRSKAALVWRTALGQEGSRVSTTIDLKPGDLTSDANATAATAFLRGASLATILGGDSGESNPLRSLPPLADAAARLHLAMGAALTFKSQKPHRLTIAYVDRGELALPEWKPILRFAAAHALPILFVVQTGAKGKTVGRPGQLSLAASACGVPGIPVDAADPVALYRVAQESMLRARAGGGPVLMECIPFQIAGKRPASADPIDTMWQFLMQRGIANEAWFEEVEARFRARLRSASRE